MPTVFEPEGQTFPSRYKFSTSLLHQRNANSNSMPLPDQTTNPDLERTIEFLMQFLSQQNWGPVLFLKEKVYEYLPEAAEFSPIEGERHWG